MRKKKKGATLIVVIIIFMFVTGVCVGMLSLAAGNYTARVSESKRVENLYSSESGLDNAYNIMIKTFDAAAQYGNYSVYALKSESGNSHSHINTGLYIDLKNDKTYQKTTIENLEEQIRALQNDKDSRDTGKKIAELNKKIQICNNCIDEDDEAMEILENEEFKRAFKAFVYNDDDASKNGDILNQLPVCIKNKKFASNIKGVDNDKFYFADMIFQNESQGKIEIDGEERTVDLPYITAEVDLKNTTETGEEKKKELKQADGHQKNITIEIVENDKYTISLQSIFKSTQGNTKKVGENLKNVQAIYTMKVPEYTDIFYGTGESDIRDYPALKDKGILVGKDMQVKCGTTGDNGFTVNKGDVFVEGDEPSVITNKTKDKYYGGITIDGSKNVKFDGKVSTRGTFNLQSDTDGELKDELYAKNLYVGNINDDDIISATGNKFNFKDVILDNDMTVKADGTELELENFYGINDKNTNTGEESNSSSAGKERTSSSIIINSERDTSNITIKDSAYIMGVAHIDTATGYQTGESIAVKGNYQAYSVPLDSSEKFAYDDPLELLQDTNVLNKAKHFDEYWSNTGTGDIEHGNPGKPNNSGIRFVKPDSVHSVGALIYTNGTDIFIQGSRYNIEDDRSLDKKRKDYASKVYKMGDDATITEYNSLGEGAVDVADLVDFNVLSSDADDECYYDLGKVLNQGGDMLIVNDSNSNLEINNDTIKCGEKTYSVGNSINAVIVSNGDVKISGDVTINGNIITCGNLDVGAGKIAINYDEEIIKKIQSKNNKLYAKLLKGFKTNDGESSGSDETVTIKEEDAKDIVADYDVGKFLENKIWKLVQ